MILLILTGCSSTPVIDLPDSQRDAKSYAVAYQTTILSFDGIVDKHYEVDDFTRGVQAWYRGDIKHDIDSIRNQLYHQLQDSHTYAYHNGIVFAEDLRNNITHLNKDCWSKLSKPSLTQGIYDAMRDLSHSRLRAEDDPYLATGTEQFLINCQK